MRNFPVKLSACTTLLLAVGGSLAGDGVKSERQCGEAAFCQIMSDRGPGPAAEPLKSGPQVGEEVPGAFHPLNVTGPHAGEKYCQFCRKGAHPVALVFAREVNEPVIKLIKAIDAATAKNRDSRMGSFVVFLSDEEDLVKQLRDLAAKEKIQHVVLTIDSPAGPEKYKIAQNAEVTVVLYTNYKVKANHAFKKDDLKDTNIGRIVADVAKILPSK